MPAIKAIVGAMVIPGLLDRYLASSAYEAQMAPGPVEGDSEGILFSPAAHDHGARGQYGKGAEAHALPANPAVLRAGVALAAVGLAAGALFLARRSNS